MAVSGFGFVVESQAVLGLLRIFFPFRFELVGQFLSALDLLLPLLFFFPQHGNVTGDVVAALGGHLVSHRADFFDGDVSLHISLSRPHRVIQGLGLSRNSKASSAFSGYFFRSVSRRASNSLPRWICS